LNIFFDEFGDKYFSYFNQDLLFFLFVQCFFGGLVSHYFEFFLISVGQPILHKPSYKKWMKEVILLVDSFEEKSHKYLYYLKKKKKFYTYEFFVIFFGFDWTND